MQVCVLERMLTLDTLSLNLSKQVFINTILPQAPTGPLLIMCLSSMHTCHSVITVWLECLMVTVRNRALSL